MGEVTPILPQTVTGRAKGRPKMSVQETPGTNNDPVSVGRHLLNVSRGKIGQYERQQFFLW